MHLSWALTVLQGTGHIDLRPGPWSHEAAILEVRLESKNSQNAQHGNILNPQEIHSSSLVFIDHISRTGTVLGIGNVGINKRKNFLPSLL